MKTWKYFLCIAVASFMLTACVFNKDKTYIVTGLEENATLETQLQELIDERFNLDDFKEEERGYKEEQVSLDAAKFMHARGYYEADVTFKEGGEGDDTAYYEVSAGQQVLISKIAARPQEYQDEITKLKLKVNDPLDADMVLRAQTNLYKALQADSCSYDLSVKHKVLLNTQKYTAQVFFDINQGAPATLGDVHFTGNFRSKPSYLRNFIPWQKGECFEHLRVEELRSALLKTDLFEKVEIIFPENAHEGGEIPIEVNLTRRAQRSFLAGLSYYTNEGIGTVLGWEHRNLFGYGERFKSNMTLSQLEQSLDVKFTKPFFLRQDQTLILESALLREENDAYAQTGLRTGAALKRQFTKEVSGRVGTQFLLSRIDEEAYGTDDNYALLAPYLSLSYDSRDDALDPKKGWLLSAIAQPYFDVFGQTSPFLKTLASAQSYYTPHDRITFAGRVSVGSIAGTSQSNVPATERFYAGGGGSVRGFGYQEIGPYENGDPVGGRSLSEASVETRYRLANNFGFVTFLDASYVSDEAISDFKEFSLGAGAGVRYYTDFGPLRFDIGTPIAGDRNADKNIQFYISIGQAF